LLSGTATTGKEEARRNEKQSKDKLDHFNFNLKVEALEDLGNYGEESDSPEPAESQSLMTSENNTTEGTATEPKCELVHVDSESETSSRSSDYNKDSEEPEIIGEQLKSKGEDISISSDDEDALEQEIVEEEQSSPYKLRRRTKRPIKQVRLHRIQFIIDLFVQCLNKNILLKIVIDGKRFRLLRFRFK